MSITPPISKSPEDPFFGKYEILGEIKAESPVNTAMTIRDWLIQVHARARAGSKETTWDLQQFAVSVPDYADAPREVKKVVEAVKDIGKSGVFNGNLPELTANALSVMNITPSQAQSPQH